MVTGVGRGWLGSLAAALAACAFCVGADGAEAQTDRAPESYSSDEARRLHEAAMAARVRHDDTVLRYTAVVRQRVAAALRTPLKDRTLYRRESAHRLFWSRDGESLVQVLAHREQTPLGVQRTELDEVPGFDAFDSAFDPLNDRLLFFAEPDDTNDLEDAREGDDFWFEHPLFEDWVPSYRFSIGDTLTVHLPDGRSVQAVELEVVPHVADVHRMTGSVWIEPRTGDLVRAVYRLSDTFDAFRDIPDLEEEEDEDLRFVPGIFKPWTAEIRLIAVDYSLWDFEIWLPRTVRMEGVVRAGILTAPATFDIGYEIEAVTTEESLFAEGDPTPEVHFETRSEAMAYLNELAFGGDVPVVSEPPLRFEDGRPVRYLYPRDAEYLVESPHLPPPIWDEAPGFASEAEIEAMFEDLADLPTPPAPQVPNSLRWAWQRPDLIRYNRVEALSVGARWQWRPQSPLGPLTVNQSARIGFDLEPNGRLEIARETLRRRITVAGYNELAAIDEGGRHLGLGNSLMAGFFGRDEGDYYRRSGATLEWIPPTSRRRTFRFRAYSEYHRAALSETDFALFRSWNSPGTFRAGFVAAEGWEHGAALELAPWWGTDPNLAQAGLDLALQGGVGDAEYARASLLGRVVVPLPASLRVGVEAGGGQIWGTPSMQRRWYLGGSRSLRGYAPLTLEGERFLRGRVELARKVPFGSVSVFHDMGWAGERSAEPVWGDFMHSLGAGVSILDGLIRIDGGYGLESPGAFRLDLYLDAIL